MHFARGQGCQEALLFNPGGNIVSCSMGNVFLVVDGILKTPRLEDGARRGVVREWVLTQATCEECAVDISDIYRATECFVTNSRIGVMPVSSLDGRILPDRTQGLHLNHLRRALDA
jgi:branched-subunit amino acid aminotransferase/4-amino-4-deoxychorismate lyase